MAQEVAYSATFSAHKFQRTKMSDSSFPNTFTSTSGRLHSARRQSYTSYCDKDMQIAFRRSLASIHLDCPARLKDHSMAGDCDSSSRSVPNSIQRKTEAVDLTPCKARRASMGDLSSYAEQRRVSQFYHRSTILEKDDAIIPGILRAPKKKYHTLQGCCTLQASPKVSSECHKEGILKKRVSFYAANSWDIDIDATPVDTDRVTRPKEESSLGNQITSLQSLIQSIRLSDLNIPTPSDTSSAPGYLEGRQSMLDRGQTGQQHQQDRHETGPPSPQVLRPSPRRRQSDGDFKTSQQQCSRENNHQSIPSKEVDPPVKYVLGDMVRSSSHMIVASCPQDATKNVSNLKNHDFAFVKRTDGSWTFAILACRLFLESRSKQPVSHEECMLFVISERGCTKIIRKPHWAEFIRIVATGHPKNTFEGGDGNLNLEENVKQGQSWLTSCTLMDNDSDNSSDSSALSF